jgi:hypothetical protein
VYERFKHTRLMRLIPEEVVLSGIYQCKINYTEENAPLLISFDWAYMTGLTWEVLALSLAVWIVIKHFHDLQ